MNVLKSFIDANKAEGTVSSSDTEKKENGTQDNSRKHLAMCACNDWDEMTKKICGGLDTPHIIDLGCNVLHSFSSSSSMHGFVLLENNALYAFGKNERGQLGTKDKLTKEGPTLVPLPAGVSTASNPIVKIATGRSHSLMLLANGEVWGCGGNSCGQLGLGDSKTALQDAVQFTRIPSLCNSSDPMRDIACGWEHSLVCSKNGTCYSFGHPMYGQLGHGTTGEFMKDGGKGPAVQYRFVSTPKPITTFVQKDNKGKVTAQFPSSSVKVRLVAAGKNHSLCVEDWDTEEDGDACTTNTHTNRVFSWGFGGYGRLGHNRSDDEHVPREIVVFSIPKTAPVGGNGVARPVNNQKQIRSIAAGSQVSCAIAAGAQLYQWGMLSNAPRGEATVYPKMVTELYDFPAHAVACGSNCIFVTSERAKRPVYGASSVVAASTGDQDKVVIAWGVAVGGKFGFEDGSKSCRPPSLADKWCGVKVNELSCGYGHVCGVVSGGEANAAGEDAVSSWPRLTFSAASATAGKGKKNARDESTAADSKAKKAKPAPKKKK